MTTYYQDPNATISYSVNWGAWLDGDTISSASWVLPSGPTKASESNTTTLHTIKLSNVAEGAQYRITSRITTAAGLINDYSFIVIGEEQ